MHYQFKKTRLKSLLLSTVFFTVIASNLVAQDSRPNPTIKDYLKCESLGFSRPFSNDGNLFDYDLSSNNDKNEARLHCLVDNSLKALTERSPPQLIDNNERLGNFLKPDGALADRSSAYTRPFTHTIDIRIEEGLMFTDVTIDGEIYNFLIDTGAPFVLSVELAEKLDFRTNRVTVVRSSNSKSSIGRIGTMKREVVLGGLKFKNFKVLVIDYNANTQMISCLGFDGIIGANFMNKTIWHIDYDNKKITITNRLKKLPNMDNAWYVKMEKRGLNKSPYIPVKVNQGEFGYVLFDTGFTGFFDLNYSYYSIALKAGKVDERIKVLEGRGLMSEGAFGAVDTTGYYVQVPELIIGREKVEKPVFSLDHTAKAKVGAEYLKGRLVTLDFPRKRFYVFEKDNRYTPKDEQSFLFGAVFNEGVMTVSYTFGKLQQSGVLRIGDVLVSIDGKTLSEMEECEALTFVRNLLREEDALDIVASRGEKEFDIKVTKSLIFSN